MKELICKIKRKLRTCLVSKLYENYRIYPLIYRSYWHSLFYSIKNEIDTNNYLTALINNGAGIGHQLAGWNSGLWWSKYFGMHHAYIGFSNSAWDKFLGLKGLDPNIKELKKQGYIVRRLPKFDEFKPKEVQLVTNIIKSYTHKKVVFVCEQDQPYLSQIGTMADLQARFYSSESRKEDRLVYDKHNFNIAIHVRRGDIMLDSSNPNLTMRYLSNDYFEKVLSQVVAHVSTDKPIHIYFFSQGKPEDYSEFTKFNNLHWCLDMGAIDSFMHMVYADLLITSKSSFSYKPALLNRGIKVCPENFWHGYPDSEDWIMVDNDGNVKWKQ